MKISVIVPVLNEMRHGFLENALNQLAILEGEKELIIVDGESEDGTIELCQGQGRLINAGKSNRAQRMNIGVNHASGDVLLFHHPRSLLPKGALKAIEKCLEDESVVGGGFSHSFDHEHWWLKYASWHSNNVRAKLWGVIYLDHCIFVRREVFETMGGFPNYDIFEDTEFPRRLSKKGRLKILPEKVLTSATRFKKRGAAKQSMLNQLLKLGYHAGIHPSKLNDWYEGKDPLNVKKTQL